jgi:hypothetical protein
MTRSRWLLIMIAACGISLLCVPAPPANQPDVATREANPVRLRWVSQRTDGTDASVVVEGLTEGGAERLRETMTSPGRWRAILTVRVVDEQLNRSRERVPAVSGRYQVGGTSFRFTPRYPLEPEMMYRAELDLGRLSEQFAAGEMVEEHTDDGVGAEREAGGRMLRAEYRVPSRPATKATNVTGVFPSANVLPENLLRFSITFSGPMSRSEAYRNLRLLDRAGKAIELPFLELDEELWSRDGRRFTLLFDPGRIKRGLKPREELGPVLQAGNTYELVIDRAWKDADGRPLEQEYRKAFRVVAPDERCPEPKRWEIRAPKANTRDAVVVRLREPLDRALLDRLIGVQDGAGATVDGDVSVSDDETVWKLAPAVPWRVGAYRLVVGTALEDVAGNSVARPFEVDTFRAITEQVKGETVEVPFMVENSSVVK